MIGEFVSISSLQNGPSGEPSSSPNLLAPAYKILSRSSLFIFCWSTIVLFGFVCYDHRSDALRRTNRLQPKKFAFFRQRFVLAQRRSPSKQAMQSIRFRGYGTTESTTCSPVSPVKKSFSPTEPHTWHDVSPTDSMQGLALKYDTTVS